MEVSFTCLLCQKVLHTNEHSCIRNCLAIRGGTGWHFGFCQRCQRAFQTFFDNQVRRPRLLPFNPPRKEKT